MCKFQRGNTLLTLLVCFFAACSADAAYTLTTLVSFNPDNVGYPLGGVVADSEGNLFGTTFGGGNAFGSIFEISTATSQLANLVLFNGSNGASPDAGLSADAHGNFYGTTFQGGTNNYGTVFKLDAGTYNFSTLIKFNNLNGAHPHDRLLADAAGNLYGTTAEGGTNGCECGTVFEIAAGSNSVTTLVSFNRTNGGFPYGGLIADAAGNLYGTTTQGGSNNGGTVFEVAAGTHALSTLANFNGINGRMPYSTLVADAVGNLYGTTGNGGLFDRGTLFEITAGSHTPTTLVTFGTSSFGDEPLAGLSADSEGNLYGTTSQEGNVLGGTVFQVAEGTHTFKTLASLQVVDILNHVSDLLIDANGTLYGTTDRGGTYDGGTVFMLSLVPEPSALTLFTAGTILFAVLLGGRR